MGILPKNLGIYQKIDDFTRLLEVLSQVLSHFLNVLKHLKITSKISQISYKNIAKIRPKKWLKTWLKT
nr:MAG TPA: hypothetical protein [Caudoviricetes sp.]